MVTCVMWVWLVWGIHARPERIVNFVIILSLIFSKQRNSVSWSFCRCDTYSGIQISQEIYNRNVLKNLHHSFYWPIISNLLNVSSPLTSRASFATTPEPHLFLPSGNSVVSLTDDSVMKKIIRQAPLKNPQSKHMTQRPHWCLTQFKAAPASLYIREVSSHPPYLLNSVMTLLYAYIIGGSCKEGFDTCKGLNSELKIIFLFSVLYLCLYDHWKIIMVEKIRHGTTNRLYQRALCPGTHFLLNANTSNQI